jgi:hypothetical protein
MYKEVEKGFPVLRWIPRISLDSPTHASFYHHCPSDNSGSITNNGLSLFVQPQEDRNNSTSVPYAVTLHTGLASECLFLTNLLDALLSCFQIKLFTSWGNNLFAGILERFFALF